MNDAPEAEVSHLGFFSIADLRLAVGFLSAPLDVLLKASAVNEAGERAASGQPSAVLLGGDGGWRFPSESLDPFSHMLATPDMVSSGNMAEGGKQGPSLRLDRHLCVSSRPSLKLKSKQVSASIPKGAGISSPASRR